MEQESVAVSTTSPEREAAFGWPGIPARWSSGRKEAVGTALAAASPVWFTVARGIVTEVFWPRVDLANTRDLQFVVAGDGSLFWEERRDARCDVALADPLAPLWDLTTTDREGRFAFHKRVLTDPDRPSLLMRCRLEVGSGLPPGAAVHLLFAPHMANRGMNNSIQVVEVEGRRLLVGWRHDAFCALAVSAGVQRASCGFVGVSDGWQDLRVDGRLDWEFQTALDGNVAGTLLLAVQAGEPFLAVLGFGHSQEAAVETALATLEAPYSRVEAAYVAGWHGYMKGLGRLPALAQTSGDAGRQARVSAMVIHTHEDRTHAGAHIASLAIPWGDAAGDANAGGYHLVWTRDLYHAATARLALGDAEGAAAALRYMERTQRQDGSWPQNFWVYGEPYWQGLQLDEVAFPVLLAWQLRRAGALQHNPYPALVRDAAYFLARQGPVTPQERWEEQSGYSPSTLAACIAALVCAAEFAAENGDPSSEQYFLEVADYWAGRVEDWMYTPGEPAGGEGGFYQRIVSAAAVDRRLREAAGVAEPPAAKNLPPDAPPLDQRAVIDGGFLELVRYGVRAPDDPHVLGSVAAYDACCRVETPFGPSWRRYTHDGYGQKDDGSPYDGSGVGRPWPLLTGERGHFEVARGGDARALVRAMEGLAGLGGMMPEQVWDVGDLPDRDLFLGRPTGAAMPLVWAHAEYVKLLRSVADGAVFDCPEPVRQRYAVRHTSGDLEIWKLNHRICAAPTASRIRLEVYAPCGLHWTRDGWGHVEHEPMEPLGHGVWVRDFPPGSFRPGETLEFTFHWSEDDRWEGENFRIAVQ